MFGIVHVSLCAIAAMAATVGALVPRQTVDCAAATAQTVPLIRAFNGFDHYYNTNTSEIARASASGWTQIATAGRVLPTQLAGTTALFRLVNGTGGAHLLTTSVAERNSLITGPGAQWTDEGIGGWVLPSQLCPGTVPFFRLYKDPRDHFSTIGAAERAAALADGYVDQGNTGFIWPA